MHSHTVYQFSYVQGAKIDENLPMVAETRFELVTFGIWAQRATATPLRDIR